MCNSSTNLLLPMHVLLPNITTGRNCEKKLGSTALAMIEELQRTMGVRVFLLAGYRDAKGQLIKTWFVLFYLSSHRCSSTIYRHESAPTHGKKFTTAHPDWKSGTYELFGDYLNSQMRMSLRFRFQDCFADILGPALEADENLDSEEEDEIPRLDADDHGYPTLPPVGHMNLDKQKVVIRIFLQTIYRMFFFFITMRY
jgi:hypothetical protein